ncbi:DUF6111 family protein [Maricaulis sp.]|uniref:DUF6111 family protein n=1 Tax=Maricaulis sp. TaxID=1486257 RepID=UPI002608F161|nr:DUF6111 family protein [Maricaulis sp.]
MTRILLLQIASFLLPFALFLIWRWQRTSDKPVTPTPVLKLSAAGAVLVMIVMIVLVLFDDSRAGHQGQDYIPPRLVDGEIQPGYFVDSGTVDQDPDEDQDEEPEDPPAGR